MTLQQAQELLDSISMERKPGAATIRRIANGEHVVVIGQSQYYCWSRQDWLAYVEDERKKASSSKKSSRNAPDYQDMLVF